MDVPHPSSGLVICYAYLWRDEALTGQEEGTKDRPCVIVHVEEKEENTLVLVSPITHVPQEHGTNAIEIPFETKRRLGLDEQSSWVVTNEVNMFRWPGYDLRTISRQSRTVVYGYLPKTMTRDIRSHVREQALHRIVSRDMSPSR